MSAQVEQQHIESALVQVTAQRRHLEPRAPHPVHQDDQMPGLLGRQIPAAERDPIGGLHRPRSGVGTQPPGIDSQGMVGRARQAIGGEQARPRRRSKLTNREYHRSPQAFTETSHCRSSPLVCPPCMILRGLAHVSFSRQLHELRRRSTGCRRTAQADPSPRVDWLSMRPLAPFDDPSLICRAPSGGSPAGGEANDPDSSPMRTRTWVSSAKWNRPNVL